MKDVTSDFLKEKNKLENQPVFLYTLYDYDGSNDLHFAEYDVDIVFNGITYTKFPITHEFTSENAQLEIDQVRVSVSNVNRLIQTYIEQYDLRGKKVDIMLVWADKLAQTSNYLKNTYHIDSYSANEQSVSFVLSSRFDVLDLKLPKRLFNRNYCSWAFKGTECAYAGVETTCDKTLQRCRVIGNELRFGGFPSIPSRNIFTV